MTPAPRMNVRRGIEFLFDKVHLDSFAIGVAAATSSSISLVRIWKGALFTIPIRIDPNRSSSRSASCTMERITGISWYSTPRPRANVISFSVIILTNWGE